MVPAMLGLEVACSGPWRTPIPGQAERRFRSMPNAGEGLKATMQAAQAAADAGALESTTAGPIVQ